MLPNEITICRANITKTPLPILTFIQAFAFYVGLSAWIPGAAFSRSERNHSRSKSQIRTRLPLGKLGSDLMLLVPISAPHLNKSVRAALAGKARVMGKKRGSEATNNAHTTDDVKMVRQHKLKSRLLTPAEQDEAVAKYQTGMTMTAVADLYGCHRTTILKLLRNRGCAIR